VSTQQSRSTAIAWLSAEKRLRRRDISTRARAGTAYAPKGGENLAPRQQLRLYKPKGSNAEQIARAVKEYREKFPAKAVIYSADGYDRFGKGARDGGGSLAP